MVHIDDSALPISQSRLAATGRLIDAVCLIALVTVMGTVIYGLTMRAAFEASYWAAAVIAVIGALVLLIGLAQQTIAARDAATWRHIAEWQVRAGHRAARERMRAAGMIEPEGLSPDSVVYQEYLVEALIADMQRQAQADTP